jgi:hypothetical protein
VGARRNRQIKFYFANAPYAHGTRERYRQGCKCSPCRAATARYARNLNARRRQGFRDPIVPASIARRHLKKLARHGIGLIVLSEASGINRRTLDNIRSGRSRNIRQSREREILNLNHLHVSDYSLVPADRVWKLIEELREEGFTYKQIEDRSGVRYSIMWARKPCVRAKTKMQIEKFYDRVMVA